MPNNMNDNAKSVQDALKKFLDKTKAKHFSQDKAEMVAEVKQDAMKAIAPILSAVKELTEEVKKKEFFDDDIQDKIVSKVVKKIPTPKNGQDGLSVKGPKGDKGEKGPKGDKGVQGDKGSDGSPDTAKDIVAKLEKLSGKERLDISAIKGTEKLVNSFIVGGGVSNSSSSGDSGDVVGPASSTDNAIARFNSTTGKLIQNSSVTLGDNGDMSWSVNTDIVALSVTNSLATSREYPVMLITNDSASGVGLRIVHTNASNSQGGIRLDSPSPEIEFVETDQVGTDGTGKFEIRVQNDIFSINGRNSADSSFEQAFTFERLADGGRMATGGENNPAAMIEAVHTGTNPYFYASSSTSADGDVFSVNNNGVLAVGNWTNAAAATGKIQLNSNATSPSSIDLSNTIAVGTGGGGANATNKFLGQFGWTSRDSSFTAPKLVAYIGAEATETYAADTDTGSDMAFYTGTNDGTSPTEKFRIGQNGLLNIGGGKTSSFPALKRSSANLQVRLGDDSAASDMEVADEAYGTGWNGSLEVPTKNAVYDKVNNLGYSMQVFTRDTNVADATTYYMGSRAGNTISTLEAGARIYIPQSGTVTKIYIQFVNLTSNGTSETSTIYFRLNDTTDTTISSAITNDATTTTFNNTALGIAVSAGDFFTLKWVTPTWATNPQGCQMTATVWIQPS